MLSVARGKRVGRVGPVLGGRGWGELGQCCLWLGGELGQCCLLQGGRGWGESDQCCLLLGGELDQFSLLQGGELDQYSVARGRVRPVLCC